MIEGRRAAKKSLGQNFLVSEGVIRGIIEAVTADPALPVFEIGPGTGALTLPLARGGTQIAAFEIDGGLARETAVKLEGLENAEIVNADIRSVDLDGQARARGWTGYALAGNIPYLLTSTVLLGLPSLRLCRRAVVMVQKEVADRVAAPAGSRECGIMSVYLQSYMRIERVMTVRPGSFRPKPKVDSTVLLLVPDPAEGAPGDERAFLAFLKAAFSQRRKKLYNVLKGMEGMPDMGELEKKSGVDIGSRPEELGLADWYALFAACSGGMNG